MQFDPESFNQPNRESHPDQDTHHLQSGNPTTDSGSLKLNRRTVLKHGASFVAHGPSGIVETFGSLTTTTLQASPATIAKTVRFADCLRRVAQAGMVLTNANNLVQGNWVDQETIKAFTEGNTVFLKLNKEPDDCLELLIDNEVSRLKNYRELVAKADATLHEFSEALQQLAADELFGELMKEFRARLPKINQNLKQSMIEEFEKIVSQAQTGDDSQRTELLENYLQEAKDLPIFEDELLIYSHAWRVLGNTIYGRFQAERGSMPDTLQTFIRSFFYHNSEVLRERIANEDLAVYRQLGLDPDTPAMQAEATGFGTNSLLSLLFKPVPSDLFPNDWETKNYFVRWTAEIDLHLSPSLFSLLKSPEKYCEERIAAWTVGPRELQEQIAHLESCRFVPNSKSKDPGKSAKCATDNDPQPDELSSQTNCEKEESTPQRAGRFRAMIVRPTTQEHQLSSLAQLAPSLLGSLDDFGAANFSVQLSKNITADNDWEISGDFKHANTLAIIRLQSGGSGVVQWHPAYSRNSSLTMNMGEVAIISLHKLSSLSFRSTGNVADGLSFELVVCQGDY